MIVFPAVLCSVTLFTCRLDGCDVFFSSYIKRVTLQSTAGNTIMTLTGNIRKYWTLRKTGKQEPSRSQSTQKRMSIISMEYPSNCQIFGNQYYEKTKQRKQPPKLQHHQTESAKVCNRVWFRTGPNSKSTNQERPQNISILCKHIIPDTHSHTLPDDGRSISRNVGEKHYDSRHDKLRNNMDTTESTNTNIFKINLAYYSKHGK